MLRNFKQYRELSLLILLIYTALQLRVMVNLPLVQHEGLNLQLSRLINQGYQPYLQIFTLDNPLFVAFLGWLGPFNLSPLGFKFLFFSFSLLFLASVTQVARFWLGQPVALATLFLLATATTFLAEAAQVSAVIPSLSLAMLSLVFICRYLAKKQPLWLLAGGALWGVSLFLAKVVLSLCLVSLIFLVLAPSQPSDRINLTLRWSALLKSVSWWLAGALIILAAGLFLVTPDIIFNHLIGDYSQIRETLSISQQGNFRLVGQFLTFNLWLFILTAYGLAELYQKPDHPLWLVVIWGLLNFLWLMVQPILQPVEVALLLPPLALIAGWGMVQAGDRLARLSPSWAIPSLKRGWRSLAFFILLLLLIYGVVSRQQFKALLLNEVDTASDLAQIERRQEIADFIAQHTDPEGCVIIDDAALAIAANRLPAPELTEISEVRILSGLLTEDQLIELVQEKSCQAVVFSKREYYLHLAGFQGLLSAYYPHESKIIQTRMYYR